MSNIYIIKYNNYFNRIIKKYDSLSDYLKLEYQEVLNISFNPNDGVNATQLINFKPAGDYAIISNDNRIVSRWFIIEAQRTRTNQYILSLRRDVIADNYNAVLEAPCFIQKGIVKDIKNPLLLNSESFQANQIKKQEITLEDKSGCPWLVAYIAKGTLGSSKEGTKASISYIPSTTNAIKINTTIANWEFYKYKDNPMIVPGSDDIHFNWDIKGRNQPSIVFYHNEINETSVINYSQFFYSLGAKTTNLTHILSKVGEESNKQETTIPLLKQAQKFGFNNLKNGLYNETSIVSNETYNKLLKIPSGSLIVDSEGKYYSIRYYTSNTSVNKFLEETSVTYSNMRSIFNEAFNQTVTPNNKSMSYKINNALQVNIYITEETGYQYTYDMSKATATSEDPLYDIICVPYGQIKIILPDRTEINTDENQSLSLMNSITKNLTSSQCYDLQLVPYCPVNNLIVSEGVLRITDNSYIIPCEQNESIKYVSIVVPSGTFSASIDKNLDIYRPTHIESVNEDYYQSFSPIVRFTEENDLVVKVNTLGHYNNSVENVEISARGVTSQVTDIEYTEKYINITIHLFSAYEGVVKIDVEVNGDINKTLYDESYLDDLKLSNEVDMYRLCSPNYNGTFEFSVAKNGGSVTGFHADCTYKPYNPYIYVHPNFSNLYGQNFEDARGLICGGEFSLGIINDAFKQYEIQNKNYQNIFDRQIQNMDVKYNISKQENYWSTAAGVVQAGMTGLAAGSVLGGPIGAGIGAIGGAATSLVGGIQDIINTDKRYKEDRRYAIDNYNMQLDNIKALPYSISRTSAITANNKKVPFIEYYSCTKQERDALKNKIKYDGMTIGVIDNLSNWVGSNDWIRGQLIRLDINDNTIADTIYTEIAKGVYL